MDVFSITVAVVALPVSELLFYHRAAFRFGGRHFHVAGHSHGSYFKPLYWDTFREEDRSGKACFIKV